MQDLQEGGYAAESGYAAETLAEHRAQALPQAPPENRHRTWHSGRHRAGLCTRHRVLEKKGALGGAETLQDLRNCPAPRKQRWIIHNGHDGDTRYGDARYGNEKYLDKLMPDTGCQDGLMPDISYFDGFPCPIYPGYKPDAGYFDGFPSLIYPGAMRDIGYFDGCMRDTCCPCLMRPGLRRDIIYPDGCMHDTSYFDGADAP